MPNVRYEIVSSLPTEIVIDLYRAGGWWDDSASGDHIPAMVRGSFCFMVAKTDDDRVIGMGRVISDGVSDGYIQDVVVRPEHRGYGIGTELVRRLTDYCREHHLLWIGLIAEPGTRTFYERLGYGALEGYQPMLYRKQKD